MQHAVRMGSYGIARDALLQVLKSTSDFAIIHVTMIVDNSCFSLRMLPMQRSMDPGAMVGGLAGAFTGSKPTQWMVICPDSVYMRNYLRWLRV